ncbi:MAG: hypothetical protein ACRDN1_05215, partial [Trebonia sp.]
HISDFTWDGGAEELRFRLADIAQRAELAGVDRISVMDHAVHPLDQHDETAVVDVKQEKR